MEISRGWVPDESNVSVTSELDKTGLAEFEAAHAHAVAKTPSVTKPATKRGRLASRNMVIIFVRSALGFDWRRAQVDRLDCRGARLRQPGSAAVLA